MTDGPILFCYDGSTNADHAIEVTAKLFGGRRSVVLDIGPPLTAAESLATISVVPGAVFEELNTSDALGRARVGVEHARAAGFQAEPRAELGAPTWEAIVDVADDIDASVIVLGSRGLSGAREVLLGSVSHDVAEHSRRPVLIVPPEHGR